MVPWVPQNRRKAVVRMESDDTHEYESCQQNDMEVNLDENREELNFSLSTLHEPNIMCDGQCRRKGFKYNDIASVMAADHGDLHTIVAAKTVAT